MGGLGDEVTLRVALEGGRSYVMGEFDRWWEAGFDLAAMVWEGMVCHGTVWTHREDSGYIFGIELMSMPKCSFAVALSSPMRLD